MKGTGILLNDTYALQIVPKRDASGRITQGLQIGNTLYQNQALILLFHPGEIKLSPLVGVGIEDMLNDQDYLPWRRKIRQQMELDGQQVKDVSFSSDHKLNIDAGYSNS